MNTGDCLLRLGQIEYQMQKLQNEKAKLEDIFAHIEVDYSASTWLYKENLEKYKFPSELE